MQGLRFGGVVLAIGACCIMGCAPPVIRVRHVIPGALPLPDNIAALQAGTFIVASAPPDRADGLPALMHEIAATVLAESPIRFPERSVSSSAALREQTPANVATVSGTIAIGAKDTHGKRKIHRRDPETGGLEPFELPTLVRTADARVEFHVRKDGRELGAVEVRRAYSSAADADVRGELGLQRGDDPERVPEAEAIFRRLLTECVEAFARMAAPVEVTAEIPLRPAPGSRARDAVDAARKGDLLQAYNHYSWAVREAPEIAELNFNYAATAEANDKLAEAAKHYAKAWELSDEKDAEAKQSAARVRRILAARDVSQD